MLTDEATWLSALAGAGITTGNLMRFDFESGPVFVSNLPFPFTATAPSDTLLNGNTFQPFENGVVLEIGQNVFSYQGSEALEIKIGLSDPLPASLNLASISKSEYQARRFVMWRAVMFSAPGLGTPAAWTFQRTRWGSIDNIEIERGGGRAILTLVIQSHAARVTEATASLWSQQDQFDPNDISQRDSSSSLTGHPGQVAGASINYLRGGFASGLL